MGKLLSQGNYNMAWLGIEPATTRSRVRRANHSATLPLSSSSSSSSSTHGSSIFREKINDNDFQPTLVGNAILHSLSQHINAVVHAEYVIVASSNSCKIRYCRSKMGCIRVKINLVRLVTHTVKSAKAREKKPILDEELRPSLKKNE